MNMEYKFKVGDTVKAVRNGFGVAREEIGKIVIIKKQGLYVVDPGYSVEPAIGNCITHRYNNMIGEKTFEPVQKHMTMEF